MTDDSRDQGWHRYRDAMSVSAKLARVDGNQALQLLNDAIAIAIREQAHRWVLALTHHAAAISEFLGKLELVRHYYQQSLSFDSENPGALLGLARVSREQGQPEVGKGYAIRSYKALIDGDHFLKDAYLDTLLHQWPDVAPQ
jgi:hypothetical protein